MALPELGHTAWNDASRYRFLSPYAPRFLSCYAPATACPVLTERMDRPGMGGMVYPGIMQPGQ
eukprot:3181459-Rhodomonas_salina.6